jgi:hypothetical protein
MTFAVSIRDPADLVILVVLIGLSVLYRVRAIHLRNQSHHPLARWCVVSIESDLPTAMKIARTAANSLGATVISVDRQTGVLFGRYRSASFIEFDVSPDEAGRCSCVCKAWPTRDSALWDWGASRRTLQHVVDYFKGACPKDVFIDSTPIRRVKRT